MASMTESGSKPVAVRVMGVSLHRANLQTRLPFRYGIATMTRVPHVFVRVDVRTPMGTTHGISADHLPPKWFTKDPARGLAEEVDEMLDVVRIACLLACGREAASAFALWRELYQEQQVHAAAKRWPPLLAGLGVSLIERAVIEAVARAVGRPFARILRDGTLGLDPALIHPAVAGRSTVRALPRAIDDVVIVRHTVGLGDVLTEDEIAKDARVNDGLPESLEAAVRAYGLRHFKIKIAGAGDADVARLARVLAILNREASGGWAFSLDGNEGFHSASDFREFWRLLEAREWWKPPVRARLLFVEQPWHREVALSDEVGALLRDWPDRPSLIIDESDAELGSLPRALELGYDGTSHKNCKGVFKGAANACLLAAQPVSERRRILSGEDLSNIGPVALLQDLAAQAALGISSIERNGHHYFRGLSFWPDAVQREMLEHHGDLYRKINDGWPTLAIEHGSVSVRSVAGAPFGRAGDLDLSWLQRVELD